MTRSVEEWVAKHDDQAIPTRVRIRVFDRHNGICHISGRKIRSGDSWQCDHIVSIISGGEHRESNLAPALVEPHKGKTRQEVAEKSRVARKRKSHLGLKKLRSIRQWRRFDGSIVKAPKER